MDSDLNSPFSRHFSTNYVPTTSEVDEITSLISGDQTCIAGIDVEIEALRKQLKASEDRRKAHFDRVQHHQALLSPARRLPLDILSSIFTLCKNLGRDWQLKGIHFDELEEPPSTYPLPLPVILSHVCRQWRELALATPLMWTVLELRFPRYPDLPISWSIRDRHATPDILTLEGLQIHNTNVARWENGIGSMMDMMCGYFARSSSCPLRISFRMDDMNGGHFAQDDFARKLEGVVEILLGVAYRWKDISLRLGIKTDRSTALRLLQVDPNGLPFLDSLQFNIPATTIPEEQWHGILARTSIMSAPALRRISLKAEHMDAYLMPLNWKKLTHFIMDTDCHSSLNRLTAREALALLDNMPNLVSCELHLQEDWTHVGFPGRQLPPITKPCYLPHLETLKILKGMHAKEMASQLDLPALHSFTFILSVSEPETEDESSLVQWVTQFGQQLTFFAFDYLCLTQSALHIVLSEVPNVQELRMFGPSHMENMHSLPHQSQRPLRHCALLTRDVLQGMTPGRDIKRIPMAGSSTETLEGCYCPKLKTLWLTMGEMERVEDAIVDMLAARRAPMMGSEDVEPGGLIQEALLAFTYRKTVDIEKELESRGVCLEDFGLKVEYAHYHTTPMCYLNGFRGY